MVDGKWRIANSEWRMTNKQQREPAKSGVFQKFEDMQVWKQAQELAVAVYEDFERLKDFSFADQIKRAAVSISNNIAEGAERTTPTEFSRFLDIAKGSTGEVQSMYLLAARLEYVDEATAVDRCQKCGDISRQLAGFAKFLRRK
jgi:four helix bundle protein